MSNLKNKFEKMETTFVTRKLMMKSLTKEGLLLTFEDGKKGYYSGDQIDTLIKLSAMPKAGDSIITQDSVNPLTQEVSDIWVSVSIG